MELTYQPVFKVVANGSDITAAIKRSFSELSITDVSGESADTLNIVLDGSKISKLPSKGAALEVSLGFGQRLYKQGTFYVSSLGDKGFPEQITIKATSTPMGGADMETSIQTQRTASYDDITISELLTKVANRNSLTPIVSSDLGAISIEHLDQTSESDMAMMIRLASQNGGVSKIADGNWLFLKEGEGKNASGTKALAVYTIEKSSCSNYQYQDSSRNEVGSVTANWHDTDTGEMGVVKEGDSEPTFKIVYTYPTEAEATAAAKAKFNKVSSGSKSFSVTTEASYELVKAFAEGYIQPNGFRSEISNNTWCIKQTCKKLSLGAGLIISISSESGKN